MDTQGSIDVSVSDKIEIKYDIEEVKKSQQK